MSDVGVKWWPKTDGLISPEALALIRQRAQAADRDGSSSDATIALLKEQKCFGIPIPTEFEGGGASLLECCALQRELGACDPGLAIALNMHIFSAGVLVEHWRRERDESWLLMEAVATQQRVIASAFAEPGLAGSLARSTCKGLSVKGGYLVSGKKVPCSLADRCDLICLQFEATENGEGKICVALVPRNSDGIKVKKTWDSLGMRGSESDTIELNDCFVAEQLVFHRSTPGVLTDEVFVAGVCWFCATVTATYLGVIREMLSLVSKSLKTSTIAYLGVTRAKLSSHQSELGEIVSEFLTLEMACINLATTIDKQVVSYKEILPAALSLKQSAVAVCTRIAETAIELSGGGAYASANPLSRLFRDSQAIRFHPPTRVAVRQILARWCLELPYELELSEEDASSQEAVAREPGAASPVAGCKQ